VTFSIYSILLVMTNSSTIFQIYS